MDPVDHEESGALLVVGLFVAVAVGIGIYLYVRLRRRQKAAEEPRDSRLPPYDLA